MISCKICVNPQGEIIDDVCEKCADVIERYVDLGILDMVHAPYMKVIFNEGKVYLPLTYTDLKDIIEDEE